MPPIYDHKKIEAKWQDIWKQTKAFAAKDDVVGQRRYVLDMFPYPSAQGLHVGHPIGYIGTDIFSRYTRLKGIETLHPMGWDAFGLPAENYAIKSGVHPRQTTMDAIANYRRQMQMIGLSYDWDREINTADPSYYKWTQWLFLKLYEKGLAYRKEAPVNWCPKDQTVLANEQVEQGRCVRCGSEVEQKNMAQWFFKITEYAERLLSDMQQLDWPGRILEMQKNWIGRSEGVNLKNKVKDLNIEFTVYDSVPQTFMAQTFTVIAPEHPLIEDMIIGTEHEKSVREFVERMKKKKAANRFEIDKEVEGVFTGRFVENYANTGRDLPIWVASFAIMEYGTGMVNCSVHDERDFAFAKKYNIPLHPVMFPADPAEAEKVRNLEYCYHHAEDGILQEPVAFAGRTWGEAREGIIDYIVEQKLGMRTVNYKIRDWLVSRQRYWGTPIPIIYCEACGIIPVPEKDLPVLLPDDVDFRPTGESPLARSASFQKVQCPKCNAPARRESDTLDTFVDSSWYFLRYVDPRNEAAAFAKENVERWLPVNLYVGGAEHAVLHLLYARFITKVLCDLGQINFQEPFLQLKNQGLILGEGGEKMSKSKGNVVNPDDIVATCGADSLRLYEMFMGPFEDAKPWSSASIAGVRRFLERVWYIVVEPANQKTRPATEDEERELARQIARATKKITEDIKSFHFNTAVSAMMELVNYLYDVKEIALPRRDEVLQKFLILLNPFAPHITSELWEIRFVEAGALLQQAWPSFNVDDLAVDSVTIAVQVNGKLRGTVDASTEASEEEVVASAKAEPNVLKWLEGKQIAKTVYVAGKLVNFVVT